MIGGTDIIVPAIGDATALDCCVRLILYYHWPDATFENATDEEKYSSYADIPFGRVEELFVYRDADAEKAWDADSPDSPLNSMLYLILAPSSVTVVTDDPRAPEMSAILESIRSELRMDILNTYAEAAA